VRLGFAILFGGIVLAVGARHRAGSKEIVSRSWERQSHGKDEPSEDAFKHL